MTVDPSDPTGDVMFATGLPPGWIEMASFRDRHAARSFLESQIDVDDALFSDEDREILVNSVARVHDMLKDIGWLQFGAVITHLPNEDGVILPTVWSVGVSLLPTPDFGDIDPIAVAERSLGRLGEIESVQDFEMDDGRQGIVLATTTSVDLDEFDFNPGEHLPQFDPQALGIFICMLPVEGLPKRIGLTIGIAPNLAERVPMSFLASQMAGSLQILEDTADLPKSSVLIDRTGLIHETGYLTADSDMAREDNGDVPHVE